MDKRYYGCSVIGSILSRPELELFFSGKLLQYLQHRPEIALAVLESNAFLDEEELRAAVEDDEWRKPTYVLYYALEAVSEKGLEHRILLQGKLTEKEEEIIDEYYRKHLPVQNHLIKRIFLNKACSEAAGLDSKDVKKLNAQREEIAGKLKSVFSTVETMEAIADIYSSDWIDWKTYTVNTPSGPTVFDTYSEAAVIASVLKQLLK